MASPRAVASLLFVAFLFAAYTYVTALHWQETFCCFMYQPCELFAFQHLALCALAFLVMAEIVDAKRPRYLARCALSSAVAVCLFYGFSKGPTSALHVTCMWTSLGCLLLLFTQLCPPALLGSAALCITSLAVFQQCYLNPLIVKLNADLEGSVGPRAWKCGVPSQKASLKQLWYGVLLCVTCVVHVVGPAFPSAAVRTSVALGAFTLVSIIILYVLSVSNLRCKIPIEDDN